MAVEVSYNLFKIKGGYDLSIAISENGRVLHEEKLEQLDGLMKGGMIVRKKAVNLDKKGLTFSLNIINDKHNKSKK